LLNPQSSILNPDYNRSMLDEATADADPLALFARWFDDALAAGVREANAMTLATADSDGRPSARIVLLKGFDAGGFVFFTNYQSRKGAELDANPRASLLLFWPALERQVRIDGSVARTSDNESDAYFRSRPFESRLGACVSPQSQTIPDRAWLEERFAALADKFKTPAQGPPRPPHWGGYRLRPDAIEFWQGRASRLHDRLLYTRSGEIWLRTRLAP